MLHQPSISTVARLVSRAVCQPVVHTRTTPPAGEDLTSPSSGAHIYINRCHMFLCLNLSTGINMYRMRLHLNLAHSSTSYVAQPGIWPRGADCSKLQNSLLKINNIHCLVINKKLISYNAKQLWRVGADGHCTLAMPLGCVLRFQILKNFPKCDS